jgi:hypothetical protein
VQKPEAQLQEIQSGAVSFADKLRSHAAVDVRELLDPEGEAVASLVDSELSPGAMTLALPIELITFETWVLGNVSDRDELDLDVGSHKELWFDFGAWIGETLRMRHGGSWLLAGDDPKAWRFGFSKILMEIVPWVFAEKLLRSGPGLGRRLLAEIERLRELHVTADEAEGGKSKDKYGPAQYARMHTVPASQWLVFDMKRLRALWGDQPLSALRTAVAEDGKKLPPQNASVLARVDEALGKLDQAKPARDQIPDRGLYEAIAQIVALRRATAPLPIDVLEKIVLPAAHMGVPTKFPPLGEDDLESIKKGSDLFAVMVDVVPFVHPGEEKGFLGTFAMNDMSTPYPDRQNLELGRGDWVMLNPGRLWPMLKDLDPKRLLASFDSFVEYVKKQPDVPRMAETPRGLAETVARALVEIRACVGSVTEGHALVFRLLPPP